MISKIKDMEFPLLQKEEMVSIRCPDWTVPMDLVYFNKGKTRINNNSFSERTSK